VLREDLVHAAAQLQDLLRLDIDVRSLTLKSAHRLVDHHPTVG
jgi:hypothetical protein